MHESYDWVIIVPAMAPREAAELYRKWKAERFAAGHIVNDQHVRMDHMCGPAGCVDRYLVLRSELRD